MGTDRQVSAMRETMRGQGEALGRLLEDGAAVDAIAERLRGRRVRVIGTGTSWHAAEQGAYFLCAAGLDAAATQSADAALDGPAPAAGQALVALTHTGAKRFTREAIERAHHAGAVVVQISGEGVEGSDLSTVAPERSAAYTASHLGALLRMAQLAETLGAPMGRLQAVPDAVERAFGVERAPISVPQRLIEFIGGGINQWTAAEGALKIRETAYVASEGLSAEQFLHGPSVALRARDHLVCLDGGGPWSERLSELAGAAERSGIPVTRVVERWLGETLSVFPLTVAVQRIALECAEALGTNPDSFGRDVPGREPWTTITL